MTEFAGAPLIPPRLAPFWDAVQARVSTARMQQVLGADAVGERIYLAHDDYPAEEAADTRWWARLVITPVTTPWTHEDMPGRELLVRWLTMVEAHRPAGMAYDPHVTLEAAQEEAFLQLHGWVPGQDDQFNGRLAAIRFAPPQPLPMYDGARDTWYTSAEYSCLISPAEETYP